VLCIEAVSPQCQRPKGDSPEQGLAGRAAPTPQEIGYGIKGKVQDM